MAPPPAATDPPEIQTVALKVSIHCEGCKKKVKKVLQRVEGVGHIDIDSKQNKVTVTVTGGANAESLIQKLGKYGKQAEIWPESKPRAAGKFSGEPKEVLKEKATVASTATGISPETEQQQQQPEKKQVEEFKIGPPAAAAETEKTAPAVPATVAFGDVTASKDNIDSPELKPSEPQAKSEMPVLAADSEKKGKKVEITGDETVPGINPPATYIMSYNTVRPSISYSHYAPSPAIPSSYTTFSGHPPPAMPSSYTTYSSYTSVPSNPAENYSTEYSYYGSMEAPAAAEESYDMFNDENPNACNLM